MAAKPSYCNLLGRYQADFFLYIAARGLSSESLALQKTFPVPFWPCLTWLNCTSHQQPCWIHMCPEAKGHREGLVVEESWGQHPYMEGGWGSSLYSAFFLLFWVECTIFRQMSVSAHKPSLESLKQAETPRWCCSLHSLYVHVQSLSQARAPCHGFHHREIACPSVTKAQFLWAQTDSALSSKSTLYLHHNFGPQGQSF